MNRILVSLMICIFAASAQAAVRPASVFTDNMVLQREIRVPVWGTAEPGEKVTVKFAGQQIEAVADAAGNWRANLAQLKTSAEPAELVISGADSSVKLTNVLVGEVWLCSGQSNMDYTMRMLSQPEKEIQAAADYPLLRLFKVKNQSNPEHPEVSVEGAWKASTPETAGDFSGTATYFGRALCRDIGVPVGLIHCAWGGTTAEAWTSRDVLDRLPFMPDRLRAADVARKTYVPDKAQADFEKKLAEWQRKKDAGENAGSKPVLFNPFTDPMQPAALYNGMIAPLMPFAMRGIIWYQGEFNVRRSNEYRPLISAMVRDWREKWGQGDFPFLYVQLAGFMKVQTDPVEDPSSVFPWPYLREAQTRTLDLTNTAMAVITDVGDALNIHPKDKKTVGERLALAARAKAYGENIVYSGPLFQSLEVKDGKAVVRFSHIGGGLTAKGGKLTGFAISGADRKWHWADAQIEGDTVVVSSSEVSVPVSVRYNWANNPIGNLFNKEGLPASMFRADVRP
ncbi:MAG: sialate O-acetylesterase [Kiritimatiellales bacterium]|jgi:sialate O-acetylesterase